MHADYVSFFGKSFKDSPVNILLINHYAGSVHHGMEYRPYYLAREWTRMGHQVTILSASYSHARTQQPNMQGKKLTERYDGIRYCWYKTPPYQGNGVRRVFNMLAFVWSIGRDAKCIVEEIKPDVVIASSTYPMDIWPAHRIAKLAKAKLVFEVHDLWPLSPMELGGMSKWHPFIMLVQQAEDYAYCHADSVVSMLPKAQSYMESRGMRPDKFHHVPNGTDTADWDNTVPLSDEIQMQLQTIKQRGKPIVGYAGAHGLANALDSLLEAAKLAQKRVEIVLVGKGPERVHLQQRVIAEGIENVTFLPVVPKASIPVFLQFIDIAYIGWHINPLYRFGIAPNKLVDYMMAGRPIVHVVEAGNDPVAEAGCGITVLPGNINSIYNAILELSALSDTERKVMGERGKRYVLAEQSYSVLAKRFLDAV